MSFWLSPRSWLNTTLGWLARVVSDTTLEAWLARVLKLEIEEASKGEEIDSSFEPHLEDIDDHEFKFLNTLSIQSYPLELIPNSSDRLQEGLFNEEETESLLTNDPFDGYADSLLNTEQLENVDKVSGSLENQLEFQDSEQASLSSSENQPFQAESTLVSFQITQTPQQITRMKIRDEEREKAKRKRKRKEAKRRKRKKNLKDKSQNTQPLTQMPAAQRPSDSSDHVTYTLNTWQRPPLRSLSKWERMGQAQMSQWQRYSPSSKALLFGSWFASLDSLVQVHKDMMDERNQFYNLVADHEEFSTFSDTELDAWWFQLNRVDHFITEYQFYKRTQAQAFQVTPATHSPKEPDILPASNIEDQEIDVGLQDLTDIPIQTFSTSSSEPTPSMPHNLAHHTQSTIYSVDHSFDQGSADEDMILRPIKRRRRRKRKKSKPSND